MPPAFPIYGNCPVGDHPALFQSIQNVRFPRGERTIVGFLVLDATTNEPSLMPSGEPYFAVAVCNKSRGTSPSSKLFKIRKAMLQRNEFDAIRNAVEVPEWDTFLPPTENPTSRKIWIRVIHGPTENDGFVADITHIKRPRDDVWESIIGSFDQRPSGQNPVANAA